MKHIRAMAAVVAIVVAIAWAAALVSANVNEVSGAGATFPYPIYAKWAEAYYIKTGVRVNYQSIGSGGGIHQIDKKTVDFGASDMPLTPETLAAKDLRQWPMVMGGVVLIVNLQGITAGDMKLSGELVADMFRGKVAYWDDPAVKRMNHGLALPHKAVIPVHRSDGSGTNFIFTHYLSQISPEFKSEVGENTSVEFPAGLGGKGNEGVAAITGRIDGAIGYVEYTYALQNKMAYTLLKNRDGHFIAPDSLSFQAAAANADWAHAPGLYLLLTNQPGAESWPITGATFILMHAHQEHPDRAKAVLNWVAWSYANGDIMAKSLDYVPMPDSVVALVEQSWRTIIGPDGTPVWH